MIRQDNGRFRPPGSPDDIPDPDEFFPAREEFIDCCGEQRPFVISMDEVELGYAVSAAEDETEKQDGYYFREFDPNSPFLALGRVRRRIGHALATRHLEERSPGVLLPLHDTLSGRISYSRGEDEVAFVIDGRFLTLSEFAKLVETYEG